MPCGGRPRVATCDNAIAVRTVGPARHRRTMIAEREAPARVLRVAAVVGTLLTIALLAAMSGGETMLRRRTSTVGLQALVPRSSEGEIEKWLTPKFRAVSSFLGFGGGEVVARSSLSFLHLKPKADYNGWVRSDLYFGLSIQVPLEEEDELGTSTQVSYADFEKFLDTVVTPLFPDGLTWSESNGQYLGERQGIIKERSAHLEIFHFGDQQAHDDLATVASEYSIQ